MGDPIFMILMMEVARSVPVLMMELAISVQVLMMELARSVPCQRIYGTNDGTS
jgi:hypothetical protein